MPDGSQYYSFLIDEDIKNTEVKGASKNQSFRGKSSRLERGKYRPLYFVLDLIPP